MKIQLVKRLLLYEVDIYYERMRACRCVQQVLSASSPVT